MTDEVYEEVADYDRATAIDEIASGDPARICTALLSLAYYDPDWEYLQGLFIAHSEGSDESVRGTALLCLGHLARIHNRLQTALVVPRIIEALNDASDYVKGCAEDALDDVLMFTRSAPYDREAAGALLVSGRIDLILIGLHDIAKNDADAKFAEARCFEFIQHPNEVVRGQALKGFATMVYENRKVDLERVLSILKDSSKLEGYEGRCAAEALEAIRIYLEADDGDEGYDS